MTGRDIPLQNRRASSSVLPKRNRYCCLWFCRPRWIGLLTHGDKWGRFNKRANRRYSHLVSFGSPYDSLPAFPFELKKSARKPTRQTFIHTMYFRSFLMNPFLFTRTVFIFDQRNPCRFREQCADSLFPLKIAVFGARSLISPGFQVFNKAIRNGEVGISSVIFHNIVSHFSEMVSPFLPRLYRSDLLCFDILRYVSRTYAHLA